MHAPARTRALTLLAGIVLGASLVSVTPAYAAEPDPQAPVVVNDEITLWPGEGKEINVLANDSDPNGDDLAVCRLPGLGLLTGEWPAVFAMDASVYGFPAGTLWVSSEADARGVHTIDYFACNHTRLTPATLTVTIRPVAPVTVAKIAGRPGLLKVTNENDRSVRFVATDRTGCKRDGEARVAAHDSRVVRVKRHRVAWTAFIGRGGVADHGRVGGIELDGPSAPEGPRNSSCSSSVLITGELEPDERQPAG